MCTEKIDVAINIFAKPFQTALALLSLCKQSREHIGTIWLQFEPAGSKYDEIHTYYIAPYLLREEGMTCRVFQPQTWFDCAVADTERFHEEAYRMGIRFESAMEWSTSRLLFLLHNDVLFHKDLVGALADALGDAFIIGQLGQCWNCPAHDAVLCRDILNRAPCTPDTYMQFQPTFDEVQRLYAALEERGGFSRSYGDGLHTVSTFDTAPWPLPECRVNEWACLLNLQKTKPLTMPFGTGLPFGAYEQCGSQTLDIGVSWFRTMHHHGMYAKHFALSGWLTHFVGTGHKSQIRYRQAENHALNMLKRFFPGYITWLEGTCQRHL